MGLWVVCVCVWRWGEERVVGGGSTGKCPSLLDGDGRRVNHAILCVSLIEIGKCM